MRWPFGPPHLTLKPSKKKQKKKQKNKKQKQQKTTNKWGGFRAKWGGPSGHLTWPLNPPKKKTKKKQKNKKQKTNKKKETKSKITQEYQKKSFSVISQNFLSFWWVSQNSLFWQLGPESAHTQNTIKIGVSAHRFVEKQLCVTKQPFLDKKNQIHKFRLSFFFPLFLLFQQQKTPKLAETPFFYSVLANLKKENFQKINLKQRNLENQIFAPFFRKRLFLEN